MSWYDPRDWSYSKAKHWLFGSGGGGASGLDTSGPNSDYAQGILRSQLDNMDRAAPSAQAAQVDNGPQDQVRAQQMQHAGYLQGILGGTQRGAGEIAVNRQVGQATAAQQAAMHAARGANAALAARNAMRNTADIGLAGAGQAAQAQRADQQMASGQLGGLLGQTRGQDLELGGQNAQLSQQMALANLNARLAQTGMNDQARAAYLQQLTGMDNAAWLREMQKRALASGDKGALQGLLQVAGTVAGAYFGGPAGAAAGGQIGGQLGGGISSNFQHEDSHAAGGAPAPAPGYGWTPEHG